MNCTVSELFSRFQELDQKTITVRGWIKTIRSSNAFGFIELNDGTFFSSLQIVLDKNILAGYDEIVRYNIYSAVSVTGTFVLTPDMKQPFELRAEKAELLAGSKDDYPLQKKRHSFEYLREIAHLRPRSNTFAAVFRLRSVLSYAVHTFFMQRGFVHVHSPIITSNDAEGAGEMFRVSTLNPDSPVTAQDGSVDFSKDFFGKETFLTVSGQLQAEAFALAFSKVYTFGPTFRAENSNTARHAAEFWMIEPEIAFSDLSDDMNLAEDMLKYIIKYALDNAPQEMDFFNEFIDKGLLDRLDNVVDSEFEHVTYTDAVSILKKSNEIFEYMPDWGNDLQTEHERYLTEKYFKKPVFVTDYPKDIKAFYMRMNDDQKTVAAVDCLVPGIGEILGGSQREERIDMIEKRMNEMHMHQESLDWYLQLRKYGGVSHAGFGLGFERALMYISGMKNIRDVIPFPRTVNNCKY